MSELEHDNNIINYVNSIVNLLDKWPNMKSEQKEIIRILLKDAKYFQYTDDRIIEVIAFSEWKVDPHLREYFLGDNVDSPEISQGS